jgi:hypothetical protein
MDISSLRKNIRLLIQEMDSTPYVVDAKKVGIDHKEGFTITLSDGRQDYAPLANFTLKSYTSAMYGCKFIVGVMRGKMEGGKYFYEFQGIDCKEYVEADPKTIRLVNQIS